MKAYWIILPIALGLHTPAHSAPTTQPNSGSDQSATEPTKGEGPTHTLFLGADFAIKYANEIRPVKRVEYGHFIVQVKDRLEKVPIDSGGLAIRVDHTLKLTENRATVHNLKVERDYTPENDPRARAARSQADVLATQGVASDLATVQIAAGPTTRTMQSGPAGMQMVEVANPNYAPAMRKMTEINTSTMAHDMLTKGEQEASEENYDAVRASFEVSAPKRLGHPYVVLVARYKDRDDERKSGNWIYARALDVVDQKPRKVRFLQGGLPVGFILESAVLHLYDGETEIATDVSDKQVRFTRAQAHQFVAGQYVVANKGKTLPAAAADLQAALKSIATEGSVWVRVGRDGLPKGIFVDEACTEAAPETVQKALGQIQFFPALEKGKAVEGVLLLKA